MEKSTSKLFITLCFCGLLAACQEAPIANVSKYGNADQDAVAAMAERATMSTADLLMAIRAQIGRPVATEPAQCKLIGLGHQPCGGPQRYLLYSIATTADEPRLLSLVQQYNDSVSTDNKAEDTTVRCQVISEPVVILINDVCVALNHAER